MRSADKLTKARTKQETRNEKWTCGRSEIRIFIIQLPCANVQCTRERIGPTYYARPRFHLVKWNFRAYARVRSSRNVAIAPRSTRFNEKMARFIVVREPVRWKRRRGETWEEGCSFHFTWSHSPIYHALLPYVRESLRSEYKHYHFRQTRCRRYNRNRMQRSETMPNIPNENPICWLRKLTRRRNRMRFRCEWTSEEICIESDARKKAVQRMKRKNKSDIVILWFRANATAAANSLRLRQTTTKTVVCSFRPNFEVLRMTTWFISAQPSSPLWRFRLDYSEPLAFA